MRAEPSLALVDCALGPVRRFDGRVELEPASAVSAVASIDSEGDCATLVVIGGYSRRTDSLPNHSALSIACAIVAQKEVKEKISSPRPVTLFSCRV